jgi:hypothetical protein
MMSCPDFGGSSRGLIGAQFSRGDHDFMHGCMGAIILPYLVDWGVVECQ